VQWSGARSLVDRERNPVRSTAAPQAGRAVGGDAALLGEAIGPAWLSFPRLAVARAAIGMRQTRILQACCWSLTRPRPCERGKSCWVCAFSSRNPARPLSDRPLCGRNGAVCYWGAAQKAEPRP